MIYTFWESSMPGYIELCLETWKFPFVILNYDNVLQYTDIDLERLKRFTLPQIADCVRVHVLRDNGGYWLDADTIVTGNLPTETILGDNETRINTCGFLHTEPQSEMFVEWAKHQDKIIEGEKTSLWWALMANGFTDHYLYDHRDIKIGDVLPYWLETDNFENRQEKYVNFYFRQNLEIKELPDMIMLHNSWTPKRYKRRSRTEVFERDCTLTNIFRELI